MSAILCVTGTDTGVGKTHISCVLLEALRAQGLRVAACKPVETGVRGDEVEQSDAYRLMRAAGSWQKPEEVCFYRYPEPAAPAVAAGRAGSHLQLEVLRNKILNAAQSVDLLLLEGAGGLMVPFGSDWLFLDLLKALAAPCILVAASRLGAINHSLLSVASLRANGLELLSFVLNSICENDTAYEQVARETNAEMIAHHAAVDSFVVYPYESAADRRVASVSPALLEAQTALLSRSIDYYQLAR